MNQHLAKQIDQVIRDRQTLKVLADEPLDATLDSSVVERLLASAAWAPFHLPVAKIHQENRKQHSIVPWRFYLLDTAHCRELRSWLLERNVTSKLPRMLAAATTLIQVTWLPNTSNECDTSRSDAMLFETTIGNMEHIAASSAAIQNFLLAATARGIPSYWSSGGVLREADAFAWLGIPEREILLGSVFLFPQNHESAESSPGKLRDKRGTIMEWSRWVRRPELT